MGDYSFFFQYYCLVTEKKTSLRYSPRNMKPSVHSRKFERPGVPRTVHPCDTEEVIFNFSSKTVLARVKLLLAFGLEFKLPVWHLDFYSYFLCFVRLVASPKRP